MRTLPWWHGILPGLDFETTGVNPREDRAVTAALLFTTPKGAVLEGSVQLVIDPGVEIPTEASDIHGYTTERARAEGMSPFDAFLHLSRGLQVVRFLGWPLVIYNASFDWPMMFAELDRHGVPYPEEIRDIPLIDPLVIDRTFDRYRKGGRKLGTVAAHYGVRLTDAHEASADVVASCQVARALAAKYGALQSTGLDALQAKQREWHSDWVGNMNDYFKRVGREDTIQEEIWPNL